jgi:hypothetical protein
MRISRPLVGIASLLLLAACGPLRPTPPPPNDVAPKQLATVVITATSVQTRVVPLTAIPGVTATATRTPIPPTLAPSPTAYVGVFMGDGSAPLELPTQPIAIVEATLLAPTPLGGIIPTSIFPTATPPGSFGLPVAGGGTCISAIGPAFEGVYNGNAGVQNALGCAVSPAETVFMAEQAFERGTMLWLANREIYALSREVVSGASNTFWKMADLWQEGMPNDDPSMTVPEGLLQPVRGFGLAWRTNAQVRSAIGWAVSQEGGYTGTVQRFERGLLLTTQGGATYALVAGALSATDGQYIGPL